MKKLLLASTFLTIGFAVPAHADPISMAVMATLSSAASAAAAGTVFTFLGLTGWAAVGASVLVRSALGYALNSLTQKGKKPSQSGSATRGYTVNTLGSALPHAIIYGRSRVGGAIFYQRTNGTANRYLHRCIAFAGHEIDSFEKIFINGEEVSLGSGGNVAVPSKYSGKVRIEQYLGTATQAASANLVAEVNEWTDAHQAKGIAYLYCRFDYDTTVFPDGVPLITATIKGKKVLDPRTGVTAWSDNPALCVRDYLQESYGIKETTATLNDTLISTAANICDEIVGGEARYTCNGSITLDEQPEEILRAMLSSMGGMIWFAQGKWGIKAAAYDTAVRSFDESDLRGVLKITPKHSRRDNFNEVKGTYRGPLSDWQETDYPSVTDAAYVTEDGGDTISVDLPLPFTNTPTMATRIATVALKRNRQQITVEAPFGMSALDTRIGDTINLTNARAGWTDKTFEVVDWRFGLTPEMDIQTNMILAEIDATVFA